jgi:hypothetical protein
LCDARFGAKGGEEMFGEEGWDCLGRIFFGTFARVAVVLFDPDENSTPLESRLLRVKNPKQILRNVMLGITGM